MAQRATPHAVLLQVHPQTRHVDKCPPPHGSAFDPGKVPLLAASRQTADSQTKTTVDAPNYFVCLDVGVWAGSSYNFGLICGRDVWLCEFKHKTRHQPVPSEAWWPSRANAPEPLRKFEEIFTHGDEGFAVKTYAHVPGRYPPREDMLYIILPDMHLPGVSPNLPCCTKGIMPTYYDLMKDLGLLSPETLDKVHIRVDPDTRARPATFLLKEDVDIFHGAGDALVAFLIPLLWDHQGKFKVVQVGDLFELWQGMDRWGTFFSKDGSGRLVFDRSVQSRTVKVEDGPKSQTYEVFEERSIDALAHRVQGILLQHWNIFHQFDLLGKNIEYLYGNHDVYLVDSLRDRSPEWRNLIGNLPSSKTHLLESHIAFEHGHRMDSFNQDGKWQGPFITEMVFVAPFLRTLDPDRREMYHYLSAADVYYHNCFSGCGDPISVFVMGHTHIADLAYVQFWKRRDEPDGYRRGSICMTCIDQRIESEKRSGLRGG